MQNIKDEVRRILTDTPYTRDNDKLLTSVYWMFEMGRLDKNVKKITFMEFSELYFTSKLTDAQTITRLRRTSNETSRTKRGKIQSPNG